jgi:hypothetical protein
MKNKNAQLLKDFVKYCKQYPNLRFWQALRNWTNVQHIYISNDTVNYNPEIADTFYFEGKDK